ncbi:MAG: hypothetical protein GY908_13905, partial [Flavobacteriales bacterium]|nr:hypothetical protein [Flavobacteriales bacterium]
LDVLTLSGRYGFPQSYDSIYKSKANEYGAMASLVAPIKMNEESIWYNSINYFYFHVGNDEEAPTEIMNPIDIHGFVLRTGLYHKFSKNRAIQVFFAPRFMSDFKNINLDHFQLGALFLYEKKFREGLKMGFGAMYNQEFFGPYLVPLVNLDWIISERWSIKGLFPVYGKIKYQVNERLSTGLSHFGLITTYRLGDLAYQGDYIERKSIDESLFARYQLVANVYLEGRFGYAIGRSYAQYEADQKVDFSLPLVGFGDNRTQKNISFHDGLIASLRFIYTVPIEDNKKK